MPIEDMDMKLSKKSDVINHLCNLITNANMLKQNLMYNYICIGRDFKVLINKHKVSNVKLDKVLTNNRICLKGYSRSMRSKYMKLSDIAQKFNAFAYTAPKSISDVLNNLRKLEEKMSEDTDFDWKQVI